MPRHLQWSVPGQPVPQKRHRHTHAGRVYDPCTELKREFLRKSLQVCPVRQPLTGPLRMEVHFYFMRPKSHTTKKGKLRTGAPMRHVWLIVWVVPHLRFNLNKPVESELPNKSGHERGRGGSHVVARSEVSYNVHGRDTVPLSQGPFHGGILVAVVQHAHERSQEPCHGCQNI
jgi:hypothetical protein